MHDQDGYAVSRRRHLLGGALLALAAALALAFAAHPAFASHVSCGDVITSDTTLDSNLSCSGTDGIVVGADGITLDLNGHAIGGSGGGDTAGIRLTERRNVTVLGPGVISGFHNGILIRRGGDNAVRDLLVSNNAQHGISLSGGNGNAAERNDASANGATGIGMFGSDGNTIRDNEASGNGSHGIFMSSAEENSVQGNTASRNASGGITVLRGRGHNLQENVVGDNGGDGISLEGSFFCLEVVSEVAVQENTTTDNGGDGIHLTCVASSSLHDNIASGNDSGIELDRSDDNTLRGNEASVRNDVGIILTSSSDDNLLFANEASQNRVQGMVLSDSDRNTVHANVASGNGFLAAGGAGIVVRDGADENALQKNRVSENASLSGFPRANGIVIVGGSGADPAHNLVRNNLAVDNDGGGIRVLSASGTLLHSNETHRNGDDGIHVADKRTTIRANGANDNGDLGIEAVPGVTDGGRNTASGNGDPRQCVNVECS